MQDKDIEFSIVSLSNEEMLFGCIESLIKTMKGSRYVWSLTVTCNDPGNGLGGRLRARYPSVTVLGNDSPGTAAASHNRVLRLSRSRYVWLASDNLLILPDTVRRVTEFLDTPQNSRVGVLGPRLLNPDGTLQPSAFDFPSMRKMIVAHSGIEKVPFAGSALGRLSPSRRAGRSRILEEANRIVDVDTLREVCVAVRTKAARQVGPMNENSGVGGEEAEWHRRFHEEGWRVVLFPEASVIHYGGHTTSDGSQGVEFLKSELHFLRATRAPAFYAMFCASLVGMFGSVTAMAWAARDRRARELASRSMRAAWEGLLRK